MNGSFHGSIFFKVGFNATEIIFLQHEYGARRFRRWLGFLQIFYHGVSRSFKGGVVRRMGDIGPEKYRLDIV